MTITRYKTTTPHHNPELKQGQTYRIIWAQPGYTHLYCGRYFVVGRCESISYLVYLHDDKADGGYDLEDTINQCGLQFVQVDLAEA